MRQRKPPDSYFSSPSFSSAPPSNKNKTTSLWKTHGQVIVVMCVLYVAVWHFGTRLPPVKPAASTPLHVFSEERANEFLRDLLAIGYRPLGSDNNDVRTVESILQFLENIQESALCKNTGCPKVEVKLHHTNGSCCLKIASSDIPSKFTNITNILLKIHPKNANLQAHPKKAILINSHFDSALGAIGATDAGALVVVMLEVIRNILNSDEQQFSLDYPLIFMFNGAEETGLLGAVGFADDHPWAKEIAFVINMDSAGTGAASLFQQNSDRVLRTYARHAPHPHTTSFAIDFFKSGKFPGDTDYRIFRDALGAPGADFAYYRDGYMYHTLIDDLEHIKSGSIQHMGDNLLALLHALSKDKVLEEPETTDFSAFFDIMGLHLVLFQNITVRILGFVLLACSCFAVLWNPVIKKFDMNLARFFPALVTTLLGMIFGIICAIASGFALYKLHPMPWFTHRILVLPLFVFPNIFGQIAAHYVHYLYSLRKYKKSSSQPRPYLLETLRHNTFCAVLLIFAQLLFVTMDMGMSFYFLTGVAFLLLAKFVELLIGFGSIWNKTAYLLCLAFPLVLFLDFLHSFLPLLVPVMGRVGMSAPVDIVVAVVCSLPTTFITALLAPLLFHTPAFSKFLKSIAIISFFGLALSIFVHPYAKDTPKRIFLQHSTNFDTNISEIAVTGWDPVPLPHSLLFDIMSEMHKKGKYLNFTDLNLDRYPYSLGLQKIPMYHTLPAFPSDWQAVFPYDRHFHGMKYFAITAEFNEGPINKPTIDILSDTYDTSSNKRTINMQIGCKGATWSNMRFKGQLVDWDINDNIPPPSSSGHFTIRHMGYGNAQWRISLTFSGNDPITFRVAGIHLRSSTLIEDMHAVLPEWMTPSIVTSSLASFTF